MFEGRWSSYDSLMGSNYADIMQIAYVQHENYCGNANAQKQHIDLPPSNPTCGDDPKTCNVSSSYKL